MSSKLKKFIWDNRKEFDKEIPPESIWENIEASFSIQPKKKWVRSPLYKWSVAAAAVLLLSTGIYLLANKNKTGEPEYATGKTIPDTMTISEAPEVNQFAKMIALKQKELRSLAKEQPELYQRFANDIDQLDHSYNTLKKQLSATPNREMLLEAMIQNLQLQLNVLNQQLSIIHQMKIKKV